MAASAMMFVDCPAYLDARGLARCGLPAGQAAWLIGYGPG
jgi:hypothetical protein